MVRTMTEAYQSAPTPTHTMSNHQKSSAEELQRFYYCAETFYCDVYTEKSTVVNPTGFLTNKTSLVLPMR